ncbi:hypothetical protein F2P81_009697 [Scophthalmus maximus]|uniref:Uncharacterized protein n=1 Tax=Scophthalmus maximus TaxID=52904 RepID=A0A6A4SS48_SCOMX|nr:hypothetical protein F2P81_009697 [Scophthalmus maximus]
MVIGRCVDPTLDPKLLSSPEKRRTAVMKTFRLWVSPVSALRISASCFRVHTNKELSGNQECERRQVALPRPAPPPSTLHR